MQVAIDYGRDSATFDVAEANLLRARRETPPVALADPASAVRAALQSPFNFPPLRRALTPDDRVTFVIDDRLPRFLDLLLPVLEHLTSAGVKPDALTLLSATASPHTSWVDDLPDQYQDMTLEVHDPTERRRLAYLATTRQGRRLYLNRSLVDADQVVVLSGRGYHPWFGYTGAEMSLFPTLSDEATLKELTTERDGSGRAALAEESVEAAWLLGVPFFVQVIEGPGDSVADVVAGPIDSSSEGRRRLDARWRVSVDRPADLVIASLSGDPTRHDFADLARALHAASQVVRVGGRVALLSRADPDLTAADVLLQADSPELGLTALLQQPLNAAGHLWAGAASHAHVYLLSGVEMTVVEQIFATPMERPDQAQRLIGPDDVCLFLEDAHKTLAVLES